MTERQTDNITKTQIDIEKARDGGEGGRKETKRETDRQTKRSG